MSQVSLFTGRSGQTAAAWIKSVEEHYQLHYTPDSLLLFALKHLADQVKACILSLTYPLERISGKVWDWDWVRVKVALRGIENQIKQYGSGKKGSNPVKVAAFGLLVGAACPLAFGLSLAAAGAGAVIGSITALGTARNLEQPKDVKGLRAVVLVESTNRTNSPPLSAPKAIGDILNKEPSKTWTDGVRFKPSIELINALLEMLVPDKETR